MFIKVRLQPYISRIHKKYTWWINITKKIMLVGGPALLMMENYITHGRLIENKVKELDNISIGPHHLYTSHKVYI